MKNRLAFDSCQVFQLLKTIYASVLASFPKCQMNSIVVGLEIEKLMPAESNHQNFFSETCCNFYLVRSKFIRHLQTKQDWIIRFQNRDLNCPTFVIFTFPACESCANSPIIVRSTLIMFDKILNLPDAISR